ncbi:MAG TPA: pyridoxal kinase PdxY [Acetobacteraceae bacterium]|nr:pyridoxal kinase PdxY [Acetobacteraceae bacterium]
MNILSIASSVAYGHVGNSAAVFPLQLLGAEVWPIATVRFSNHPGYGGFTGTVTEPAEVRALVDGIAARGVLGGCDAVLSGYLGAAETGAAVLHAVGLVRAANPGALYCCDPVIGDDGPGVYVRPGVAAFLAGAGMAAADIVTPNRFELGWLTGQAVDSLAAAKDAAAALAARLRPGGPRVVVVTSLRTEATPAEAIDVLAAEGGRFWLLRTPLLPMAVNGAGDALAALFLFHFLRTRDAGAALAAAGSAVQGVLRRTLAAGGRELALVSAREEIVAPSVRFGVAAC